MNGRTLITLVTAAVIAAVVAGLIVLGSPQTARERRFDERRVADLVDIDGAIDAHLTRTSELPQTLRGLTQVNGRPALTDPVTGQGYEYIVHESDRYELCAVFSQAGEGHSPYWRHGQGRTCFTRRTTRTTGKP